MRIPSQSITHTHTAHKEWNLVNSNNIKIEIDEIEKVKLNKF